MMYQTEDDFTECELECDEDKHYDYTEMNDDVENNRRNTPTDLLPSNREAKQELLVDNMMQEEEIQKVATKRINPKELAIKSRSKENVLNSNEFKENRYDGVKIKNIGFWNPENQANSNKRSYMPELQIRVQSPGELTPSPEPGDFFDTTSPDSFLIDDIQKIPDKRKNIKKLKKNPVEIRNDWKDPKYNLLQYETFIEALVSDRPIKPILLYLNTETKHKEQVYQMLKDINECETFVLKYYNENGNAVVKTDGQLLSKANNKLGKIALIVIDTITTCIDGNFISMVNSCIRAHTAGGAILITGASSSQPLPYKFTYNKPTNLVLIKNFQQASIQCEDVYVRMEKRIRKLEKSVEIIKEKLM